MTHMDNYFVILGLYLVLMVCFNIYYSVTAKE